MAKHDFTAWSDSIRALLDELATQDFGYPLGVNEVRPPAAELNAVPADLVELYAAFDGMSLPDVHVGYFIDSAHRVASAAQRGEPTRIHGAYPRSIHVFGSDGGGGRFALDIENGAIYYLPSSGSVRDGVFFEDDVVHVHRIAGSILEFLRLLKADIAAFVRGDEIHKYMV